MRSYELTPAAQRALGFASAWLDASGSLELQAPEVLLGLLEEPECRAALLLAKRGVTSEAVASRWPGLKRQEIFDPERSQRISPELQDALLAAQSRLADYPRPLELATEHLLLGLAAGNNEVATWLSSAGVDVAELEAEIHRLAGHQPGPLPWDSSDIEPVAVFSLSTSFEADRTTTSEADTAAWRLIDAAANRATEGLRVVEDYARFCLDDRFLTSECKTLRHDLTTALASLLPTWRHAARDTTGDVGTVLNTTEELARSDSRHVAAANLKRAQQALRSLEEFGKTISAALAGTFEQLRYRCYTLEKALDITAESADRLTDKHLYVLVDGRESNAALAELVDTLVSHGADILQLRDKHLTDGQLLERARLLVEHTRGTQALAIVNDRPDIARLARADGVHVGQDDLSIKQVRAIIGPEMLVGVSTHSLEQARTAVLEGANYIGVGPTFPSTTKSFAEFTGLELVAAVAAEIRLPAFAIGGISDANVRQVCNAGLRRVAVSGAVLASADPGLAVSRLRGLLVE